MVKCGVCSIDEYPFTCKYCGKDFCSKHRLPEDHNCEGINKDNVFSKTKPIRERNHENEGHYIGNPSRYTKRHRSRRRRHKKRRYRPKRRYLTYRRKKQFLKIILLVIVMYLIYHNWGSIATFFTESWENETYEEGPGITTEIEEEVKQIEEVGEENNIKLINGEKRMFDYTLKGKNSYIKFTVYPELNDHLASLDRAIWGYGPLPSDEDFIFRNLDNEEQKDELLKLVEKIKEESSNQDERARIAISLVQTIPYDWTGFRTGDLTGRYSYEVLYDDAGVCGEKSELLAFLLRELGFGVALFRYPDHQAVGIKCSSEYDYQSSGYCFIETASPSIITDSKGDYIGLGRLGYPENTIEISDGKELLGVKEEYEDAKLFQKLTSNPDPYLSEYEYSQWEQLIEKYGIEIGN